LYLDLLAADIPNLWEPLQRLHHFYDISRIKNTPFRQMKEFAFGVKTDEEVHERSGDGGKGHKR
jgi:hypothetical protein